MTTLQEIPNIRILPDDVANKIAAGEVVERPASVVKELVENALDARATRVAVRMVAAGRRLIEVQDNGHGMTEQNALLAVERHATSKIRTAQDLDGIRTLGFRGEALASIASVSRFALITRRAGDDEATQVRIDGGILRAVEKIGAPTGTRVSVNRLYFNTPVRAKFLKGITTELGHCIDVVQRHALSHEGVAFQLLHNDKILLDIPEQASLRDRVALIWGLNFVRDLVEVQGESGGFRFRGVIGHPGLNRAARSHQFFFINGRPVINRSLQYGLEDAFRGLLTVGRYPVCVLMLEANPRFVDVNIHPTKREVRFRDDRAVRDALREVVRTCLEKITAQADRHEKTPVPIVDPLPDLYRSEPVFSTTPPPPMDLPAEKEILAPFPENPVSTDDDYPSETIGSFSEYASKNITPREEDLIVPGSPSSPEEIIADAPAPRREPTPLPAEDLFAYHHAQPDDFSLLGLSPEAVYEPAPDFHEAPIQVFDTYLLVPDEKRLLIIDQHALHERLNFEELQRELTETGYESQQLAVPLIIEVAPSQVALLEEHLDLFDRLGVTLEPFGGNTFQVTAICHLYEERQVPDLIFQMLDELAQGHLFDQHHRMADMLRLASRACKASVRAGDRLTPEECRHLLKGFRRLRPPYTCPHGRPIIVELTRRQMEKSFRRIQ